MPRQNETFETVLGRRVLARDHAHTVPHEYQDLCPVRSSDGDDDHCHGDDSHGGRRAAL